MKVEGVAVAATCRRLSASFKWANAPQAACMAAQALPLVGCKSSVLVAESGETNDMLIVIVNCLRFILPLCSLYGF